MSKEKDTVETVLNGLAIWVGLGVVITGLSIYFNIHFLFVATPLVLILMAGQYVLETVTKAMTDSAKIARGDKLDDEK